MFIRIKNLLLNKTYNTPTKNNLALFFVLFLPSLFIFVIGYTYISNILTKLTYANFEQIATHSADILDSKLTELTAVGQDFSENIKFDKAINSKNWKDTKEILSVFKESSNEQFIDGLYFIDDIGTVQAESSTSPDAVGKNFSFRDWFNGVFSTGKPYVSNAFQKIVEPKENIVAVAIPVLGDDQKISGILLLQVNLDHFLHLVKNMPVGLNGFVYTVDRSGQIVASPQYVPQGRIVNADNEPYITKVLAGEVGTSEIYDAQTDTKFIVSYHPSLYGWGVLVQQPSKNAFVERIVVERFIIILFILVLVINIFRIYMVKNIVESCECDHN